MLETQKTGFLAMGLIFLFSRLKDKRTVLESELTDEQRRLSENYLPQPFDPNSVDREMCQCFAKLKLLVDNINPFCGYVVELIIF